MDEDILKIIWYECCAREGFCVQLRVDLEWDKDAFDRLTEAMRRCCKYYEIKPSAQEQDLAGQASGSEHSRKKPEADLDDLINPPLPTTKRLFPDWLAEIFWYLSNFVKDWTSDEVWDLCRAREPEYFAKAYQRLQDLASWFFTGDCPWPDEETGWSSTFVN